MATVKALIVAGGGGGATRANGGRGAGGGGGGVIYNDAMDVLYQAYPVVVGNGGSICFSEATGQGGNSSFNGSTAIGGGGGAYGDGVVGHAGGSGGGGWYTTGGGAGTTGQGYAGGAGQTSPRYGGGGGGGAGQAGGNGTTLAGGKGGDGIQSSISGTSRYYGGGGSSDVWPGVGGTTAPGIPGLGGGGTGNNFTGGTAGAPNTGGGGGSGDAAGGSGIVIVRYPTNAFGSCMGGTITYDGEDTIHTFTADGTFTVVEKISGYKTSGTALFGPILLPTMTDDPQSSSIGWTHETPVGTSIVVSTAISDSVPAPEDYVEIANGGAISGLTASSSGKNLYIQVALSTADISKTPKLLTLGYAILEAIDEEKIVINLLPADRLKYPIGDVTVTYNKAQGNLVGLGNVQVDSFALTETPENVTPVFNPHDVEHISATLTAENTMMRIYYEDAQAGNEHISASLTTNNIAYHVNDIPQ